VGRRLFAGDCADLATAVERFLAAVTPEQMLLLDTRAEEVLRRDYTALVHVCMTGDNVLKEVENALVVTAREYAAGLLPATNAADLFFERYPTREEALEEVRSLFSEAAPELARRRGSRAGPAVGEVCVLASPAGPAGERFRELLREARPDTEVQQVIGGDDVVIYRERTNLSLAELELLGPLGHDAYAQMTASDNFTPHARVDVEFKP
jgi:hypothetical protein